LLRRRCHGTMRGMLPGDELPWIVGIRAFEDEVPDGEAGVAAWRAAIEGSP